MSSLEPLWEDSTLEDEPMEDPQYVADYVKDIFTHMASNEMAFQPRPVVGLVCMACEATLLDGTAGDQREDEGHLGRLAGGGHG